MNGLPRPQIFWRLSAFYWFYFATIGIIQPFWAPYLTAKGLQAKQIAPLVACLSLTKILWPYFWTQWAQKHGGALSIGRLAAFLAWVTFIATIFAPNLWSIALATLLFSAFWNACLPSFEANTLYHLRGHIEHYGRIRWWGSAGYVIAVLATGYWLNRFGYDRAGWIIWASLGCMALSGFMVPRAKNEPRRTTPFSWKLMVSDPNLLRWFWVWFLIHASHGPYYAFYSLYLIDYGYAPHVIGGLWTLGVVAEVIMFQTLPRVRRYVSDMRLIQILAPLSALRWIIIATFPDRFSVIAGAQVLHMISFALLHATAMQALARHFKPEHLPEGHALYLSVGLGAGLTCSQLLSGFLWDLDRGHTMFLCAGLIAFLAWPTCVTLSKGMHPVKPV